MQVVQDVGGKVEFHGARTTLQYSTLQRQSAATRLAWKLPTLRGSRSSQDSSWVLRWRGGNIRDRKNRKLPHEKVFTDNDWAGCRTQRSTSGGLVMLGWHPLRTWSSTQSVVFTSSAELYSAAEGASRGLGLQSMPREMGVQASLTVSTDSSSAISFASTRGLGSMRHHMEENPGQLQCV